MEQLFQDTQGQYLAASVKNGKEEHMQTSAFMSRLDQNSWT